MHRFAARPSWPRAAASAAHGCPASHMYSPRSWGEGMACPAGALLAATPFRTGPHTVPQDVLAGCRHVLILTIITCSTACSRSSGAMRMPPLPVPRRADSTACRRGVSCVGGWGGKVQRHVHPCQPFRGMGPWGVGDDGCSLPDALQQCSATAHALAASTMRAYMRACMRAHICRCTPSRVTTTPQSLSRLLHTLQVYGRVRQRSDDITPVFLVLRTCMAPGSMRRKRPHAILDHI